jgi:anaerobic ribonucleoside-triphosphate reductase
MYINCGRCGGEVKIKILVEFVAPFSVVEKGIATTRIKFESFTNNYSFLCNNCGEIEKGDLKLCCFKCGRKIPLLESYLKLSSFYGFHCSNCIKGSNDYIEVKTILDNPIRINFFK